MSQLETPKLIQPELIPGPYPVQLKGHLWARWLLKLIGWRVDFQGLPSMQGVAIVYPHTSNWDFLTAMLSKWTIGMPIFFLTKDSFVQDPLGGSMDTMDRWCSYCPFLSAGRSRFYG